MAHHILQHGAGILMILTQLRTAKGMAKQKRAVGARRVVGLFQKALQNLTRDAVDAAYGRQDPQLVADPDVAIGAAIDLHLAIARLRRHLDKLRPVVVLVQIAQVGARVAGVDHLACGDRLRGVGDRQPILDHQLALGDGPQRELMAARHRLLQLHRRLLQIDGLPRV